MTLERAPFALSPAETPEQATSASPVERARSAAGRRQQLGRRDDVLLAGLLACFVLCAAMYSVVAPLWEASDESEHFQYVVYLLTRQALPGRLPTIQPSGNNEGNQPPLYYLLAAPLAAGLDLSDAARIRLNPHMGWLNDPSGQAATAHLLDEAWPYDGAFLAAHRIRLLSTLLGAATLLITYAAAARTAGRRLALPAAVLLALLPGFIYASATIDNDALANLLAAVLLLILLRSRAPTSARTALLYGSVCTLALLTKLDTLVPVIVGSALLLWEAAPPRRAATAALIALPLLPAAAFWLWRLSNGERNLVGDKVAWPPPLPGSNGALDWQLPARFLSELWTTFLGAFGRQNVLLPGWLYAVYGGIFVVGLLAAAWPAGRCGVPLGLRDRRLLWCWTAAVLGAIVARYLLLTGPRTGYASARFLYPALPAIIILTICGWSWLAAAAPRLRLLPAPAALGGALTALALPFLVIRPAYPPPFPVTDRLPAGISQVSGGQFGQNLALAGVSLPSTPIGAGQAVNLTFYWRVQQPLPDGTWLFVHVADQRAGTAAAFDGVPLYGQLPLSYWRRGDVVIDTELLTVHGDARSGAYAVTVGWYDPKTGRRVPLASGGNEVTAGELRVVARAASGAGPRPAAHAGAAD